MMRVLDIARDICSRETKAATTSKFKSHNEPKNFFFLPPDYLIMRRRNGRKRAHKSHTRKTFFSSFAEIIWRCHRFLVARLFSGEWTTKYAV
jgi:hypothetical protein